MKESPLHRRKARKRNLGAAIHNKLLCLCLLLVVQSHHSAQSMAAFTRSISSSIAKKALARKQSTFLSAMPSSKKRPGVPAAVRLASIEDVSVWERIEQQYNSIRKETLLTAEKACRQSQVGDGAEFDALSKDQLLDIVQWKFAVGKPRPQNLGLLRANTDTLVQKCSRDAIQLAKDIRFPECVSEETRELTADGKHAIKKALEELTRLRGVGPATATAVLCRVRPDIVCYMYDEVIDCFEAKRDYTMNIYLRVNAKCLELAKTLGGDWTTARIAKVLWIAARVSADGGDDLTKSGGANDSKESQPLKIKSLQAPGRKRRKTK